MKGNRKRNNERTKHMFLKIWLRIGIPILAVTVVALFLFGILLLLSVEMVNGGHRVQIIGAELAQILSNTDLTDKAAVENQLDLSKYHMIGILFDPNGREVARSDFHNDTEDSDRIYEYQKMEDTLLEIHEGKGFLQNNQVHAFEDNYWYDERPVLTPRGEYMLYCAGVTATWHGHQRELIFVALMVLALMVILTIFIALSYYRIHKMQQAMEADYSQKVNVLAHNLKTPMMIISGYSENFLAEIQTDKKTHYAEKILENVNKMNTIVEEMLEFTSTKQL